MSNYENKLKQEDLSIHDDRIVKINERHYKIVEAYDITAEDLNGYQIHENE